MLFPYKKNNIYNFFLILFFLGTFFSSKLLANEEKKINNQIINIEKNSNQNELGSDYILGSGDILKITFENLEIFSDFYSIDPQGNLTLPELDSFNAKGLTLEELKNELTLKYSDFIFNPKLSITIETYRPVNIYISGEITNPGIYTLQYDEITNQASITLPKNYDEFSRFVKNRKFIKRSPRVFDAIKIAGGVTNNSDLSNIKIIRNNSKTNGGGKIQTKVNFLSLLLNGDTNQNIRLLDGDNIIIPKTEKIIKSQIKLTSKSNLSPDFLTVYITGNVKNPGEIQVKKGSSLNQAIAISGGKKDLSGVIDFVRFENDGSTYKKRLNINIASKPGSTNNPILMDGDMINLRRNLLGVSTTVLGEISSPLLTGFGIYSIFN